MILSYAKLFIKSFIAHTLFSLVAFSIFKYLLMKMFVLTLCELAIMLIGTIFTAFYRVMVRVANENKICCHFKMFIYEQAVIETMKKLELQELDVNINNLSRLENWLRKEYDLNDNQINEIKTCYATSSIDDKDNKNFIKLSIKGEKLSIKEENL